MYRAGARQRRSVLALAGGDHHQQLRRKRQLQRERLRHVRLQQRSHSSPARITGIAFAWIGRTTSLASIVPALHQVTLLIEPES
jgi:hypothetical protein